MSARNAGFGDNLLAAANCWYYAKATRRALAIVWTGSRYLKDKRQNAFMKFFALPASVDGVEIYVDQKIDSFSRLILAHSDDFVWTCVPNPITCALWFLRHVLLRLGLTRIAWWCENVRNKIMTSKRMRLKSSIIAGTPTSRRLLTTNDFFYCTGSRVRPFFEALRLNSTLQTKANEYASRHFCGKKVIGVHIRYYHKDGPIWKQARFWQDREYSIQACVKAIKDAIGTLSTWQHVIFVATNDKTIMEEIQSRFAGVVSYDKPYGRSGTQEMHEELPQETAEAAAIEMFLLGRSDILIRYPLSAFSEYGATLAKSVLAVDGCDQTM